MRIPSMRRWTFSAAVPTATRHRCSQQAAPPRASSATKRLREISASTLVSPPRWLISHSAAGKKVSSASFTAKAATPSNFLPSQRSSSNAGRARKRASSNHANETPPPRRPRADRVRTHTRIAFLHRSRDSRNREVAHFPAHLATRWNSQPGVRRSKRREADHLRSRKFFHRRCRRRANYRRPRQAGRIARFQQRLPPSRRANRARQRLQERPALPISRLDLHAGWPPDRHTGRRRRRILRPKHHGHGAVPLRDVGKVHLREFRFERRITFRLSWPNSSASKGIPI